MSFFIPEVLIQSLLESALVNIRADLAKASNISFLYKSFYGVSVGKLNYYTEIKKLFQKDIGSPNYIEIRRFFDPNRASLPTIHITLPGESFGDIHGLGNDEGFNTDEELLEGSDTIHRTFTKSFSADFNLVFTGRSSEEALLLHYVIKAYLLSIFDELELIGLNNVRIGAADLQLNSEIAPFAYFRSLSINFSYLVSVPKFVGEILYDSEEIFIDQGMPLNLIKFIPIFDQIGPLVKNSTPPALPTTSLNGAVGTWLPVVISTSTLGTFVYVFTPTYTDNVEIISMSIVIVSA